MNLASIPMDLQSSERRRPLTSSPYPVTLTGIKPEGRKKIADGVSHGELHVRNPEPGTGRKAHLESSESRPVPSGPAGGRAYF